MEQQKIGKFILELRKQRGFTQKELAERIGVSDKTISKWECGNSIPDTTYLESLCKSLNISVNELLSGQCLSGENYSKKAEENIVALMKENENNKKESIIPVLAGGVLIVMSLLTLVIADGEGLQVFSYCIDLPCIISFGMLCAGAVLISGKKTKMERLGFLQKTAFQNGVLVAMFQFLLLLRTLEEVSKMGPMIAMCVLSLFYAAVLYVAVSILKAREERKENL